MTEILLKLLGARTEEVVRVAEASVAFRGGLGMGWIFLAVLAACGLTYWMYRNSPATLSSARTYTLMGLRMLFLILILMLLMRPVLSLTVEGSVRRILVVLLDESQSMQIKDPRATMADQKRAALADGTLDPTLGLDQSLAPGRPASQTPLSRLALVKTVLQNEKLNLLPKLDGEFDLSAFRFGEGLAEISARKAGTETNDASVKAETTVHHFPWVNQLNAESPVTALGDALREVINRKRGQPLAGVFLLTDGANNSGSQPREAASLCRQEGLPLYVYGVGITSPRDIIVGNLFAPEVTFVRDEVPLTVRLRIQGLVGESADLVLKLGNRTVATQTITFASDGEQVVPMAFTPDREGEFDLTASIEPRADETVRDNNSRSQRLRVIDAKIKVLLADQSPRWEFRYLQAMLMRDRRVDLSCWLVEA